MDINNNEEQVVGEAEPASTEPEEIEISPETVGEEVEVPPEQDESEVDQVEAAEDDPSPEPDGEEIVLPSGEEAPPEEVEEEVDSSPDEEVISEESEIIEPGDLDLEGEASLENQGDEEAVVMEDLPILEEEPVLEETVEAESEADVEESTEVASVVPEKIEVEEEVSDEEEEQPVEYKPLAVPIKDDGRAWFVVHCYSGNEDKVRHNIMQRIESMSMDDLIFDVVVPTEDEVNIKNGERQTIEKKVFPGYILVNMILTEESWYMVRNTPGVTGFVGMGNDPTPLQPEEVARILKRMESESPRINVTFRPGERVRIVDGPFEDFYGKVSEIDMERATVRVMVNFFGRETPVELDFLQVEEA